MRKRTSASSGAGGASRALSGKAARGVEMTIDLGPQASAAAVAVVEKREPRPYSTRYPIPDDVFRTLKDNASEVTLAKGAVPVSTDKGAKSPCGASIREKRNPRLATKSTNCRGSSEAANIPRSNSQIIFTSRLRASSRSMPRNTCGSLPSASIF